MNLRPDEIVVIIFGLSAIIFTYWFFLSKREEEIRVVDSVDIKVSGGYSPAVITIQKGKATKLNFIRTDPTDCLEEVVLSDFKVRKKLPLNQRVSIEIKPQSVGEFGYSCGMGMYHGRIIVR